eukprot:CAMPEP_0182878764 /NCGR_PEP_ID=MMETSP0034_2-20130328/15549_1 /TAXON_ID=156128 /ORGANISM="Nephroselmis pyriformis, Strain CCMP717" /LENGTH=175 /DNA_ID=CAMNT_0025011661 /DNA_START=497 /DNA_END=1024 /DNA_ORIENTATION=+
MNTEWLRSSATLPSMRDVLPAGSTISPNARHVLPWSPDHSTPALSSVPDMHGVTSPWRHPERRSSSLRGHEFAGRLDVACSLHMGSSHSPEDSTATLFEITLGMEPPSSREKMVRARVHTLSVSGPTDVVTLMSPPGTQASGLVWQISVSSTMGGHGGSLHLWHGSAFLHSRLSE